MNTQLKERPARCDGSGTGMSRLLAACFATVLAIVGCSSNSATTSAETTTTAPTSSSTSLATTSTIAASTATDPAVTRTADLVYMSINGVELLMDVYSPTSGDASPLVITFHGNSEAGKGDQATIAEEAATQGMVVFVPNWFVGNPIPVSPETLKVHANVANCAVAFAQQHAAEYGGDPAMTVVDGFSAGTYPVMWASLQPAEAPIPGCGTNAVPTPVVGAVLGDGEYLLQDSVHDGAFETDPVGMQAEVSVLLDPSNWSIDAATEFFLWTAADGTNPRTIGDPADTSGWLASRDGDGSIKADLERLGLFEDGLITYSDTGQLLHLRMSDAGVAVTLDEYPGGHYADDKLSEIVAYFTTATGQ